MRPELKAEERDFFGFDAIGKWSRRFLARNLAAKAEPLGAVLRDRSPAVAGNIWISWLTVLIGDGAPKDY
jgi:hypothetical protein